MDVLQNLYVYVCRGVRVHLFCASSCNCLMNWARGLCPQQADLGVPQVGAGTTCMGICEGQRASHRHEDSKGTHSANASFRKEGG